MRTLVLASHGRHPVSGKPYWPRVEAQAARLAASVASQVGALHAGPSAEAVREALGRGVETLRHLKLPGGADPTAPLVEALRALAPDLIVAGRRGEGGEDTGLLPYAIAHALGLTLIADAIALESAGEGLLRVTQAQPKGARRLVVVRLPALVTVHPGAPPPRPYAHGLARAGVVVEVATQAPESAPEERETRPYRVRPKAFAGDTSAPAKSRVLVDPDPHEAAAEILAFLREIGVLAAPGN